MRVSRRVLLLQCLFIFIGSFAVIGTVLAAELEVTIRDTAYGAKLVSQMPQDPIEIEAGASRTATLKFKNTGTAVWNEEALRHSSGRAAARFISAYTIEPRLRASAFKGKNWLSSSQTGKMWGTVKPGQIGELTIDLSAPTKTGEYTEKFYLAAEDHTWVKGGYFFLKINVLPAKTPVSAAPVASSSPYQANRFMLNPAAVTAKGGEDVPVTVAWQNVGEKTWHGYAIFAASPSVLAGTSELSLADELWESQNTVFHRAAVVEPGAVTRETFSFRAPARAGAYTASFHLSVDGTAVADGLVEIPVTVTENAPNYVSEIQLPVVPTPTPSSTPLATEPRIRVGIWKKPDSFVQFRSEDDDYQVYDGATLVGILPRTRLGVLKFANSWYEFKGGDLEFTTQNYIRLMPAANPHAVFTLWNMERKIKWKGGSRNFNQYRGGVEYHLTEAGTMYVINDLLLEDYVGGIGEASNIAPHEFLKAQAVVSRTYAYFIANNTDKHDSRNFDVVATTGDQLYLGYVGETITPNFVQAVQDTRGLMVTYERNIVITPYFGHSNGKTRSWTQAWGGSPKPWLVSVKVNYDKGLKRYGHGVGMSQRDAAFRAEKEGLDWKSLVKYYYTGVEVEKVYN